MSSNRRVDRRSEAGKGASIRWRAESGQARTTERRDEDGAGTEGTGTDCRG